MASEYMRNSIYSYIQLEDDPARNSFRDDFINSMRNAFQENYSYLFESDGFDLKHAPHNFYLNAIKDSIETHNQSFSVTFPQILNSGSKIVDSLHLNYLVDFEWVCLQYMIAAQNPRMTIIYQKDFLENNPNPNYADLGKVIKIKKMLFYDFYHRHHSKISIFKYNDGKIRIMISTANLFVQDWENRTQGFWISPLLPPVSDDIDGESKTQFKKDFLNYLKEYPHDISPLLEEWRQTISNADFSGVDVFFIGSVIGNYSYISECAWGHLGLKKILSDHIVLPSDEASQWPLIIQASCISNVDRNFMQYYSNSMLQHSRSGQEENIATTMIKIIYPSLNNVRESLDYQKLRDTHLHFDQNSEWLRGEGLLSQWKADNISRSTALPHIKSYARLSTNPGKPEILWFVLTSANLSKGAWGIHNVEYDNIYMTNFEAGVVFVPKMLYANKKTVAMPKFQLPYDVPLTAYEQEDEPYKKSKQYGM